MNRIFVRTILKYGRVPPKPIQYSNKKNIQIQTYKKKIPSSKKENGIKW